MTAGVLLHERKHSYTRIRGELLATVPLTQPPDSVSTPVTQKDLYGAEFRDPRISRRVPAVGVMK